MVGEIELFSDGDGLVVAGDLSAAERFLDSAGLLPSAEHFALSRLSTFLKASSDVAKAASGIAEQSALYLKLTPESAKQLKDVGGLMPTKTKGISHAMLGDPGTIGKWLQVEDGPISLVTNPAALAGLGGLMSQFAQQAEAQELKALLIRIDEKLDDVRRGQRDAVLAKMDRAAAAIEEAMTIRTFGGDPGTLWDKVSGESGTIHEVQNAALRELGNLAAKVDRKSKTQDLKKVTQEIEREAALQLSILARCFELQDGFRVVELDHVLATAPEALDGHRLGVAEARQQRRTSVLEQTERLMEHMDAAGGIAKGNILLHARAARSVVDSLNSTAALIDDFQAPLGIESSRQVLGTIRWREALREPEQLKSAGAEVGQKAALAGGAVAVVALGAVGRKNLPKGGS